MITITEQVLTDDVKKWAQKGLANHAITSVGSDEKGDSVAFIAREGELIIGAFVAAVFWGALHLKLVYVDKKHRGRGIATQLMQSVLSYGSKRVMNPSF